jgi:hypothetical protein
LLAAKLLANIADHDDWFIILRRVGHEEILVDRGDEVFSVQFEEVEPHG